MSALNRKLRRDLWRLRGQVVAIGFVLASGVAVLIMSLGMIEALRETATAYYERANFAHVFATLRRAPEHMRERIARIPGVQSAETRIVKFALLDVPGFDEPIIGQLVSIPERGPAVMNRLVLRAGRRVAPGRPDEVVLNEPFAEAHKLKLGASFSAIINGHRRRLRVVGLALSPEFIYSIGPGALMPDEKRFGVLWMGREALAAAFDLKGAFNNVTLTLLRGANPDAVVVQLDRILAPYGSIGAIKRAQQISNWFLMNEIEQLKSTSSIMPAIFLVVAAFLANMVLARLISVERAEIGLLKAFGYSSLAVGWHYAKLVMAMTGFGIVLGWLLGSLMGRYTTEIYADLFNFPFLYYRPSPQVFAVGALVSLAATLVGAAGSVRRAVALPPAEAMRPPAPPRFRRSRAVPRWMGAWVDQPSRIILRQLMRWPGRAFLTSLGIGMSVALVVMSYQWIDAINHLVRVYFEQAQHQSITVALDEARSTQVLGNLKRLPGVMAAEGVRAVPVRFRVGARSHRESIQGVDPAARLSLVYDSNGTAVMVPRDGLVLSTKLAEILHVGVGDTVEVEILDGRQPHVRLPVVRLFETYIGTPSYMHIDALNRLMRQRPVINIAHLLVDPRRERELYRRLKDIPAVTAVLIRRASIDMFHETMAETLLIYVTIFTVFACALAFGVVYNNARIALSERGRELATLRVMGFSRFEISYILLGEVALLTFVALPLGCLVGSALASLLAASFDTELFRIPLVIELRTYGISVVVGLAATIVSAAIVRRRVDRLDLISVLKTRE